MNIESLYKIFKTANGVCTDTRKITKGVIYFSLKGANFNGNAFAESAIKNGASYAIVDEKEYQVNDQCILVDDCLKTLQELANYHRKRFDIPFIAITGSNGKTTSKELIYTVLSTKYKTYATKGNLNNHIGIPLTLLAIQDDAEIAIIEMGANHQKEIEGYCQIAEPTHGIITNIGKAHLDGFGGFEGVKKGKGELYQYLKSTGGKVFVNTQNSILMEMNIVDNAITYPTENNFYSCSLIDSKPYIRFKAENKEVVNTQLIGTYNFDNIAAALCIGKYFEVPENLANKAIADYVSDNNRSQIVHKGSNIVILDAYNANPSSMNAAIDNFSKLDGTNKVVILGDMFELGQESDTEHQKLGQLVNEKNFSVNILCGVHMQHAAEKCSNVLYFTDRAELEKHLQNHRYSNSHILIKGSRGMGLEKTVDLLTD